MAKTNKTKKEIIDFIRVARRLSKQLIENYTPGDPIDIYHQKTAMTCFEMILDWAGVEYDD